MPGSYGVGRAPRGTTQQLMSTHVRRIGAQRAIDLMGGASPPTQYPRFPRMGAMLAANNFYPYASTRRRGQPRYY